MKQRTSKENLKLCNGCTNCCEYIRVIIPTPKTLKHIDRIKWYLLHNVHVCIDDGDWLVEIPMKCTALNNEGKCSIYKNRPQLCRNYSQDTCWKHGADNDTDDNIYFTSVKEFEKYLNRNKKNKK